MKYRPSLLQTADCGLSIQQQDDEIHISHRILRDPDHGSIERRLRLVYPRRIDHDGLHVYLSNDSRDAVPSGLRFMRDCSDLSTDHLIQ